MMREPRPKGRAWRSLPVPPAAWIPNVISQSMWTDGRLSVVSSHVSVSRFGKRPKPAELARAQREFSIRGWEEDNHHPGHARHYFRPVDPAERVDCECKSNETTHVEPDGYRWTNPTDEPCRGCEFAAQHGKTCPIHPLTEEITQ